MRIVITAGLMLLVIAALYFLNQATINNQKNARFIFGLYIAAVLILTLGIRTFDENPSYNLHLFQCYKGLINQILYKRKTYGVYYNTEQFSIISTGICNIAVNIVLFMPLGYLLPRADTEPTAYSWRKILLTGLVSSLIIETLQLVSHRGCFDLDDLFHNSLGAVLGFEFGKYVNNHRFKTKEKRSDIYL